MLGWIQAAMQQNTIADLVPSLFAEYINFQISTQTFKVGFGTRKLIALKAFTQLGKLLGK